MTVRRAECRCGQLTATIDGEPGRVSVCHCTSCRLRSGGAFSAQARFPQEAVTFGGNWNIWEGTGGSGAKARYRWCPACGSTIAYVADAMPDMVAILLGAIVEGPIPTPGHSVYEERAMPWVEITGADVIHHH